MARNTNNGAKREIGRREDVKGMARLEVCCSKKTQMQRSVDNNESWVVVVAVLCLCSGGRKREMGGQQRLKRTARAAEAQRERRPDANAAPWRRDSISIEHGLRLWASLCVCVSIPSTSRLVSLGGGRTAAKTHGSPASGCEYYGAPCQSRRAAGVSARAIG
jgi:hypothetical protein